MADTIEFVNITKYFPGVKALADVSFKVHGGEILAFIGENGAGKSTLLKTLFGDYQPSSGDYLINNEKKLYNSPLEALDDGVSVIYQERQILMDLSVAENLYLGNLPVNRFGIIDVAKLFQQTADIIKEFELPIEPATKVKNLSIAHQQMVEIMKAYARENLRIIAFDEPTASLSDAEIESLFKVIYKLKKEGKIILYVTHRMQEIQELADKVAIFKDGEYIDTVDPKVVSEDTMVELMTGRNIGDIYDKLERNEEKGDILLEVNHLTTDYFEDVSFAVRAGEIVGFSGLVGAGRTEVMRGIIGADTVRGGSITLDGESFVPKSPKDTMEKGIVLVPEDRKTQGILANLSVGENITISMMKENSNRFGFLNKKQEEKIVAKGIKDFKIKTPNSAKKIVELSGGNQQKTIISRWISTNPKVLILDEPTKGIDVGTKSEFYKMACDFARKGMAVIIVSSELPEVIGLSDRIIVMKAKKIVGELPREEATESNLLSLAMLESGV